MSLDTFDVCLQNEIQLLNEVYDKELFIEINQSSLKIIINLPIESVKDSLENFIHLKLEINCSALYPTSEPSVCLSEYWGLEDSEIEELYNILRSFITKEISEPDGLIYRIIQLTSDQIDHNLPQTKCAICLDKFSDPALIFATPAHHFFHKICIETYAATEIEQHNISVYEAKKNNQYISFKDLPQLNLRCPICRAEELCFENEPIGDINSWKNDGDVIDWETEEIIEYLKKNSLRDKFELMIKAKERADMEEVVNKSDEVTTNGNEELKNYGYRDEQGGNEKPLESVRNEHVIKKYHNKGNINQHKGFKYQKEGNRSDQYRQNNYPYAGNANQYRISQNQYERNYYQYRGYQYQYGTNYYQYRQNIYQHRGNSNDYGERTFNIETNRNVYHGNCQGNVEEYKGNITENLEEFSRNNIINCLRKTDTPSCVKDYRENTGERGEVSHGNTEKFNRNRNRGSYNGSGPEHITISRGNYRKHSGEHEEMKPNILLKNLGNNVDSSETNKVKAAIRNGRNKNYRMKNKNKDNFHQNGTDKGYGESNQDNMHRYNGNKVKNTNEYQEDSSDRKEQ